jgi:hypothetical protein
MTLITHSHTARVVTVATTLAWLAVVLTSPVDHLNGIRLATQISWTLFGWIPVIGLEDVVDQKSHRPRFGVAAGIVYLYVMSALSVCWNPAGSAFGIINCIICIQGFVMYVMTVFSQPDPVTTAYLARHEELVARPDLEAPVEVQVPIQVQVPVHDRSCAQSPLQLPLPLQSPLRSPPSTPSQAPMKSPEIAMEQFELEPSHYPGSNHSSPHTEYSNLSPPLPVSSSASSASSESETSRTVSIHSRPSSPSRIQPSPCGATSGSPCCEVCSEQMTTPTEGSDVLPPEYPVSRPPSATSASSSNDWESV